MNGLFCGHRRSLTTGRNKMRRVSQKMLFFAVGVLFTIIYCEFMIYYVFALQCNWPQINTGDTKNMVKAFILADIHMLGPFRGHWADKWRREWQMHRAYQAILTVNKPDIVFILGDLFDEGERTNEKQFEDYVDRFYRLFSVADGTQMYIAVGNHDIGFHHNLRRNSAERFAKMLNSPPVQHVIVKDNHFILVNSMALHGDSCSLCTGARRALNNISEIFQCSKDETKCSSRMQKLTYSRPILLQHFPLYRISDAVCTEPDAPPFPERNKKFRLKIDSLSKEATEFLVHKISPRAVFGGHTHHGCLLEHEFRNKTIVFKEYSVPSFSWRNRPDPKYMLVTITPDAYDVIKCGLPMESTIAVSAVILLLLVTYISFRGRNIGLR